MYSQNYSVQLSVFKINKKILLTVSCCDCMIKYTASSLYSMLISGVHWESERDTSELLNTVKTALTSMNVAVLQNSFQIS